MPNFKARCDMDENELRADDKNNHGFLAFAFVMFGLLFMIYDGSLLAIGDELWGHKYKEENVQKEQPEVRRLRSPVGQAVRGGIQPWLVRWMGEKDLLREVRDEDRKDRLQSISPLGALDSFLDTRKSTREGIGMARSAKRGGKAETSEVARQEQSKGEALEKEDPKTWSTLLNEAWAKGVSRILSRHAK